MLARFHKLPIGKKLQVINLLIVGLMTLLTIGSLCIYMYSTLRENYRENSITLSSLLAESEVSALMFGDKKAAQETLNSLRTVSYVKHAELYDHAGILFSSYAVSGDKFDAPPRLVQRKYPQDIRFGRLTFDSIFPVHSIAPGGEQIGSITMQIDLSEAYAHLGYQIATLLLIGMLGAALVSAALTKMQRSITLPLVSLTATMRKVSKHSSLASAELSEQDEIEEMASAFNHMVGELSSREQLLKQELQERRRIEAQLSQIAHFDSITNLPNRHSFNSQIDKALINYKYDLEKFALIYIDLDNFKYVNDTFGHHIGDMLLAKIGGLLRKTLRKEDFVGRLGGDEFVIIMTNFTDNLQIGYVVEKIFVALKDPFTLEGHEAFIGASIGIAICPDNGKDSETLKRQADSAMYRAKNLGKNNFQFYQDEMSRTQENRVNIEAQLHRALERAEMVVNYQPIVAIESQRIVGFEALVRWVKEDGTVIRPDQFITLAEEIGLIVDIGRYVLNTAAVQTAAWVERFGLDYIAVNFSSRQFKHNDLAADIFNALKNARLQPCNFEMEITESVLMDNNIDSKNFLAMLIKQGVGISIDDFGTGYSSLSYITSFPITKIKIDISFVAKLPHDKNALAVVTAIIGLAKSLDLKVVAEGIETTEQLECLARLGCPYGQGYLFSKPVSASAATKLLEMGSNGAALSHTLPDHTD